ncbi:hypothetical protein [Streptomyces sp. NPDC004728]|uniref:hypothetical protein n=1 Tax=Streptomyces sp. NPDC004728 TaxID=3154289 RepID=UPI0033B8914C
MLVAAYPAVRAGSRLGRDVAAEERDQLRQACVEFAAGLGDLRVAVAVEQQTGLVDSEFGVGVDQGGPADGRPPMVSGMDIARARHGVIIELYTIVTEIRRPSRAESDSA